MVNINFLKYSHFFFSSSTLSLLRFVVYFEHYTNIEYFSQSQNPTKKKQVKINVHVYKYITRLE